jgi:hypothetical protein
LAWLGIALVFDCRIKGKLFCQLECGNTRSLVFRLSPCWMRCKASEAFHRRVLTDVRVCLPIYRSLRGSREKRNKRSTTFRHRNSVPVSLADWSQFSWTQKEETTSRDKIDEAFRCSVPSLVAVSVSAAVRSRPCEGILDLIPPMDASSPWLVSIYFDRPVQRLPGGSQNNLDSKPYTSSI